MSLRTQREIHHLKMPIMESKDGKGSFLGLHQ